MHFTCIDRERVCTAGVLISVRSEDNTIASERSFIEYYYIGNRKPCKWSLNSINDHICER